MHIILLNMAVCYCDSFFGCKIKKKAGQRGETVARISSWRSDWSISFSLLWLAKLRNKARAQTWRSHLPRAHSPKSWDQRNIWRFYWSFILIYLRLHGGFMLINSCMHFTFWSCAHGRNLMQPISSELIFKSAEKNRYGKHIYYYTYMSC